MNGSGAGEYPSASAVNARYVGWRSTGSFACRSLYSISATGLPWLYSTMTKSRSTAGQLKPQRRCRSLMSAQRQLVRSWRTPSGDQACTDAPDSRFRGGDRSFVDVETDEPRAKFKRNYTGGAAAEKRIKDHITWLHESPHQIPHTGFGLLPVMMILVIVVRIGLRHVGKPGAVIGAVAEHQHGLPERVDMPLELLDRLTAGSEIGEHPVIGQMLGQRCDDVGKIGLPDHHDSQAAGFEDMGGDTGQVIIDR